MEDLKVGDIFRIAGEEDHADEIWKVMGTAQPTDDGIPGNKYVQVVPYNLKTDSPVAPPA